MGILKNNNNKKIDALLADLSNNDSYSYLINSINKGKKSKEMREHLGVTRQRLHQVFINLYKRLIEIEPKLEELADSFDTFLDLTDIVEPFWASLVADTLCFLNKEITKIEINQRFFLYHKDLQVLRVGSKLNIQLKDIPFKIDDFAKKANFNAEILTECFNTLYKNDFIIFNGYVLARNYHTVFSAIHHYGLLFDDSTKEMFDKFNEKYPIALEQSDINTFEALMDSLSRKIHSFNDAFIWVDKGHYESINYLNKTDVVFHKTELHDKLVEVAKNITKRIPCSFDLLFLLREIERTDDSLYNQIKDMPQQHIKKVLLDSEFYVLVHRFILIEKSKYENCLDRFKLKELIHSIIKENGSMKKSEILAELEKSGRIIKTQSLYQTVRDSELLHFNQKNKKYEIKSS